jgi:aarF domain-containing kinase
MAGRRFVDAAKLFQASKAIASKHITLRSQQFEAYQKTSSLAKAVKSQTDRVTLTAAAAVALYQRSNEAAPTYTKAAPERPATNAKHEDIPRRETVQGHAPEHGTREGLKQDHHYDRSGQTTAAQPPPEQELDVEQRHCVAHCRMAPSLLQEQHWDRGSRVRTLSPSVRFLKQPRIHWPKSKLHSYGRKMRASSL